jgi:hypothetical protein
MSSKFGGSVSSSSSKSQDLSKTATGLTTISASRSISVVTKPYHAFGIRGPLRDNVDYLSESRLIYPVGKRVCTYAIEKKQTDFIDLHPDVQNVIGVTVAPNRKRVAFCELSLAEGGATAATMSAATAAVEGKSHSSSNNQNSRESKSSTEPSSNKNQSHGGAINPYGFKSQVSVYHALQGVHLRTLSLPSMKGVFTNCCFTADNKFLVAIGSAPDFKLVYWKWSNMKMISSVSMSSEATRIRVNPNDSSQLTTTGPNHCKLWTLEKDLSLKCSSLIAQKLEKSETFVDHTWTKIGGSSDSSNGGGLILVATEKGTVLVLQMNSEGNTEVRQTIHLFNASHYKNHHQKLETIQSNAKGFVAGGSCGYFAVYEQTDDQKDPFLPIRAFKTGEHDHVSTIAISPLSETVCSFIKPSNQLIMFPLAHIDMIEQNGTPAKDSNSEEDTSMINPFTKLRLNGFHAGAILDLSTCFCCPIIATVGTDRTIRIWDYVTWECVISFHTPQEEPVCVTIHPSGFHLLVGFKERIRMYNILKGELKEYRSLPIKNCRQLRFSSGGNIFACAYGINLEIYNTNSFKLRKTLMGHIRPIRQMKWLDDGSTLYTVGMDGACLGWDASLGTRIDERTMAPNMFAAVAIDRKVPMLLCSTTAGELMDVRRIPDEENEPLKGGTIHESVSCGSMEVAAGKGDTSSVIITQMVITNKNNALICGTSSGCVRVYPWPLIPGSDATDEDTLDERKKRFTEIQCHSASITGLDVSFDDTFLFSTGEDGSVFIHELIQVVNGVEMKNGGNKPRVNDENFNTNAMLVSREDMEEKMLKIKQLTKDMKELQSDTEYTLHVKDSEWGDQLKSKAEEMDMALNAERERYESLQQRHEAFVREHMEELDKRDHDHIKATQRTENQYEHKLAIEISRYDEVSEAMERQAIAVENEMLLIQKNQEERIRELESKRKEEVDRLQDQIAALERQIVVNIENSDKVLEQTEHENLMEIQKWKHKNSKHVERSKAEESRLKAQLHAQTDACQKLRDKMEKIAIVERERDHQHELLKEQYRVLEANLKNSERLLEERDASLQQKERDILGLKSKQSTLENFKYVLNHRIQMLSKEKGPIAEHIGALEKHIREMYRELVVEFNIKKDTTMRLDDALMKVKGQSGEIRGYINKLRKAENEIAAMQSGLHNLVKYTDPKDYEAATRDLYKNFVKKEKGMRAISKKSSSSNKSNNDTSENEDGGSSKEGSKLEDGSSDDNGGGGRSAPPKDGATEEASRQRDYMERTVHTLKKTLRIAGQRMQQKSQISMTENTVLINECNMLRRENHRHRQKIAEQVSKIRDLSNQLAGPPGSRSITSSSSSSHHLSHHSNSRVLESTSMDPRDMLQSRGGSLNKMSGGGGLNSGGSSVVPGIKEGSEWEEGSGLLSRHSSATSLPRPESTTQTRRRRQVSTAAERGSTARKIKSRNVSTASLGGASGHLRASSRERVIPGKVIRGSKFSFLLF